MSDEGVPGDPTAAPGQKVNWDDTGIRSTYANVANVASTREEVFLLFGTHQNWHSGQDQITVQLSDRVVMSPFAAKRLLLLLNNLVSEYEKKYGAIDISG